MASRNWLDRTIANQVLGLKGDEGLNLQFVIVDGDIHVRRDVPTSQLQHGVQDFFSQSLFELSCLTLEDTAGSILKSLDFVLRLLAWGTEAHSFLGRACHLLHRIAEDFDL